MNFLKTALLGGLFVLLPLMLLWLGLKEIAGLLVEMATPIADSLPGQHFENLNAPGIVAILLIIATSLLLGILAKSTFIANIGHKFETSILYRIPMYRMLKIISSALIDGERSDVAPAIYFSDEGTGDPCYVMEEHASGLATVLIPWSPASFAGSIKLIPKEKLQYLNCTLDDFSRSISFMGVGVEDCIVSPEPTENSQ